MKRFARLAFVAVLVAAPGIAHAGFARPQQVPTLGEVGLLTFAAGLLTGGVVLIRRRGK